MMDAVFMLGQIPVPLALVVSVNDVHDDGDQYSISVEMRRDLLRDEDSYMAEFPVFPRGDAATAHNLMAELVDAVAAHRQQPLILSTNNVTVEFHRTHVRAQLTGWQLLELDGGGTREKVVGIVSSEAEARSWEGGNGFRRRQLFSEVRDVHHTVDSWQQSADLQRVQQLLGGMTREQRKLLSSYMDSLPQLLKNAG